MKSVLILSLLLTAYSESAEARGSSRKKKPDLVAVRVISVGDNTAVVEVANQAHSANGSFDILVQEFGSPPNSKSYTVRASVPNEDGTTRSEPFQRSAYLCVKRLGPNPQYDVDITVDTRNEIGERNEDNNKLHARVDCPKYPTPTPTPTPIPSPVPSPKPSPSPSPIPSPKPSPSPSPSPIATSCTCPAGYTVSPSDSAKCEKPIQQTPIGKPDPTRIVIGDVAMTYGADPSVAFSIGSRTWPIDVRW